MIGRRAGDIETIFDRLQKVTAAGKHLCQQTTDGVCFSFVLLNPACAYISFLSVGQLRATVSSLFEHEKRNAYSDTGSQLSLPEVIRHPRLLDRPPTALRSTNSVFPAAIFASVLLPRAVCPSSSLDIQI